MAVAIQGGRLLLSRTRRLYFMRMPCAVSLVCCPARQLLRTCCARLRSIMVVAAVGRVRGKFVVQALQAIALPTALLPQRRCRCCSVAASTVWRTSSWHTGCKYCKQVLSKSPVTTCSWTLSGACRCKNNSNEPAGRDANAR